MPPAENVPAPGSDRWPAFQRRHGAGVQIFGRRMASPVADGSEMRAHAPHEEVHHARDEAVPNAQAGGCRIPHSPPMGTVRAPRTVPVLSGDGRKAGVTQAWARFRMQFETHAAARVPSGSRFVRSASWSAERGLQQRRSNSVAQAERAEGERASRARSSTKPMPRGHRAETRQRASASVRGDTTLQEGLTVSGSSASRWSRHPARETPRRPGASTPRDRTGGRAARRR